ncbi:hypothetical protein [Mahella australiensis]|uniref:Uncharacterized protein n=1 Tax=Mahella australiensis (strain DSM 15567 / CIP 107919 / 50-1 BON) TaxID=697281 RepID=F3ZZG4_MAHA5|nr:hypothetical protein [Mahella australiensis]AEE95774.1 hypothetical protein Mahau_0571 [Mahella australiensis 50-1 BON]
MKFTISESVSNTAWSNVDKGQIWRILKQGIADKAAGVAEAVREVYAVVKASVDDNLTEADCWGPHHEVREDGTVVLNRAGLIAAVAALSGARSEPNLTPQQAAEARQHLLRHYKELEMPIPATLVSGEIGQVQATISGEISINDVPLASWANLDTLKAGDQDPLEVVVEIPAGKSKRGWNYKPEALKAIVGEVMSQGLPGFLGHQKPEDVDHEFPPPVTHWVGAKWDPITNKAYFRGVIDKSAEDLKRWIKSNVVRTVSIFGIPKLQQSMGETQVVDYQPLSIDWTPLGRAGMPTAVIAVGEMDEIINGGVKMNWRELVTQLKQALANKDVTLSQVVGEMGFTTQDLANEVEEIKEALAAKQTLGKVKEVLAVSGEMDIIEAAGEARKALDEKAKAKHEKLINEAIAEKVTGEMTQGLVKKMLHVADDATKEQIVGEIDALLKDEALKDTFSKLHTDKPAGIGITSDGSKPNAMLITRKVAI